MRVRLSVNGCDERVAVTVPATFEALLDIAAQQLSPNRACAPNLNARLYLHDGCRVSFADLCDEDSITVAWDGESLRTTAVDSMDPKVLLHLSRKANEKLRQWLEIPPPWRLEALELLPWYQLFFAPCCGSTKKFFAKASCMESIGCLVALATLDGNGDGTISPAEHARYERTARAAVESVKTSSLNGGVIAALALSISAPLAVAAPLQASASSIAFFTPSGVWCLQFLFSVMLQLMCLFGISMLYHCIKTFLALSSYLITTESQVSFLISSPTQLQETTWQITLLGASAHVFVLLGVSLKSPWLGLVHLACFMWAVKRTVNTDNHLLNCFLLTHSDARHILGYKAAEGEGAARSVWNSAKDAHHDAGSELSIGVNAPAKSGRGSQALLSQNA